MDDIFRTIALPATAYNAYESISQSHSKPKIIVRCAACAGTMGLLIHHFATHHFQKGKKPDLTVKCPNPKCNTVNDQHDLDYVRTEKA